MQGDPLGLFRRVRTWSEVEEIFVHPRTVPLPPTVMGLLRDMEGQPTLELSPSDVAFHALREYAPGDEFGVFYYRLPGNDRGEIFSITEKKMPVVTGDGVRTLEQLILYDERAVCMADHYLGLHAGRLGDVLEEGERVELVELGTHCRGAIFLDGMRHRTPELERVFDEISRGFDGFWFGRYDVRTPDVEAFRRGEAFKIVELNGVTSEATHIYDPRHGLSPASGADRILARPIGAVITRGHDRHDPRGTSSRRVPRRRVTPTPAHTEARGRPQSRGRSRTPAPTRPDRRRLGRLRGRHAAATRTEAGGFRFAWKAGDN